MTQISESGRLRAIALVAGVPEDETEALVNFDGLLNAGFRYAFALCHDPFEAEDLVQDACASVLAIGGPWQKAYVFTAIRNHFIDRYRRRQRVLFLPLEGEQSNGSDPINEIEGGDWEMPDFIAAESLHRALGELRPEERETIFLAVVEEFTAQEIADMTDRPRGTILSLLHRTRKKLRAILEREEAGR